MAGERESREPSGSQQHPQIAASHITESRTRSSAIPSHAEALLARTLLIHCIRDGRHQVQPPQSRGEADYAGKFDVACLATSASQLFHFARPGLQEMREVQRETSGEIMAEALEVSLLLQLCFAIPARLSRAPCFPGQHLRVAFRHSWTARHGI